MDYRIKDINSSFYWSNKDGWVGKYESDTYKTNELPLPIDGEWEEIPDYSDVSIREQLIIEKALGTIFCGSTDDTAFYHELMNCESEEEYEEVCNHFDAYLWEPHEHAYWEWVIEEVSNNYISCTVFASQIENLIKEGK